MSSDPPGVRPPMLKSMDEAMRERMHLLLKSIMKLNHARAHFNVPVDWKKLKLLQYPEIIKDPMDLGMVEKKLEADRHEPFARKHYQLAEEFAHDVRLVWKNALVFNYTTSSPVYKSAKALAEIFEDKLAKAYRRSEMLGPPCPLKTRCQLLLSDIRRNPLSEWYRRAADWKIFGPSYVQGLSSGEPMDLDQVQRRLAQGDYDVAVDGGAPVFKADAFARDMGLIWRNAMEFNKEGVFWLCPKILKDTFDRRQEMLLGAPVPRERGKRREERDGWPSFERKRDPWVGRVARAHAWRPAHAIIRHSRDCPTGRGLRAQARYVRSGLHARPGSMHVSRGDFSRPGATWRGSARGCWRWRATTWRGSSGTAARGRSRSMRCTACSRRAVESPARPMPTRTRAHAHAQTYPVCGGCFCQTVVCLWQSIDRPAHLSI